MENERWLCCVGLLAMLIVLEQINFGDRFRLSLGCKQQHEAPTHRTLVQLEQASKMRKLKLKYFKN
jgi:hypothetical protein